MPGDNQCLRVCVATLFDLPVEDVPFFGGALAFDDAAREDGSYGSLQEAELRAWLRARGLDVVKRHAPYDAGTGGPGRWSYHHGGALAGLGIAEGPTERGTYHAVVWRHRLWGEGELPGEEELRERLGTIGVMAHDPHPSGAGLLRVEAFKQFIVVDPARAALTGVVR